MKTYLDMLQHVLDNGTDGGDRTGTGTRSVFGYQARYDLQKGFPLVTTKRVWFRGIVEELLWMLRGSTDVTELEDRGITIWSEWKGEDGTIGEGYGRQFRAHLDHEGNNTIDQVAEVIESLRQNPDSRRHVISLWNPADMRRTTLPCCHGTVIQFNVRGAYLDCQMMQRSADCFLGVPYNIASYSLLTHMIAQVVGLEPGHFVHTLGDLHIYSNHMDQVLEQLSREPKPLPTLRLNPDIDAIDDFTYEDIELIGYEHHPAIKAPVAV